MVETDIDSYKLNSDDRKQSLRISLINNEKISLILIDIMTKQRYSSLVNLSQLKQVCEVFQSINNIKEALNILKNTIESGNIMITEDPKENIIELKYTVILNNEEYPPFDINLLLEGETKEKENVQVLPPKFDYQGNKEAESKYGNTTNDTTEYVKPIVESNVKPPILQLEYIEPILQVHYPDGTTKSTPLPPRIQGVDGKIPDITEEQFKSIQEQMNKNSTIKNFSPLKDFLYNNRSNSVARKTESIYSTQSTPYPTTNNIARVNPEGSNQNTQIIGTGFNLNKNNNNYLNDNLNKTSSGYSVMTMKARPLVQNTNLNSTNVYQRSNYLQDENVTNIIERRPRIINRNTNKARDINRSMSVGGHQEIHRFNTIQNSNKYQTSPTDNNPFQPSNVQNQNNNQEKYPYDRNTQRVPIRNNAKLSHYYSYQQYPNNNVKNKTNLPQNSLSHLQRQQQRLQEVQQKLAQIQMQQRQLQERQKQLLIQQQTQRNLHNQYSNRLPQQIRQNIQTHPKDIRSSPVDKVTKNHQFQNQIILQDQYYRKVQPQSTNLGNHQMHFQSQQIMENLTQLNQIKHINSLANNQQSFQHQSSQEIKETKTQMINRNQNPKFKTQTSAPIPSQTSSLGNKDINQQLISLAQMASMQNEANPNFNNLQAVTLNQQKQQIGNEEEQEEIQEYHPQGENQKFQYEKNSNENEVQIQQTQEQNDINIEALFFTEDGRVIFRNGLLRGIIHKYAEIDDVVTKIQDKLLKGVKFNLVYKAFDVGDRAKDFHEICDKLEMSLVLIETDEDVRFGGFTTKSWAGHCLKKNDINAFVFSLETNKIFDIIPNEPAIGCYPKFGPVFFGCQIRIYDEFFTKGGTTCHKGLNYRTKVDYELNNGKQNYLIKDIEVYGIETIDI